MVERDATEDTWRPVNSVRGEYFYTVFLTMSKHMYILNRILYRIGSYILHRSQMETHLAVKITHLINTREIFELDTPHLLNMSVLLFSFGHREEFIFLIHNLHPPVNPSTKRYLLVWIRTVWTGTCHPLDNFLYSWTASIFCFSWYWYKGRWTGYHLLGSEQGGGLCGIGHGLLVIPGLGWQIHAIAVGLCHWLKVRQRGRNIKIWWK